MSKYKEIKEKYGVKPKPVILKTKEIKAILEGRKTQFRIAIQTPRSYFRFDSNVEDTDGNPTDDVFMYDYKEDEYLIVKSKYQKGQILWVREAFVRGKEEADCSGSPIVTFYKADGDIDWVNGDLESVNTPWKPSVLMPKKYARIFLKVTDVRVQKLRDLSHQDKLEEGIFCHGEKGSYRHIEKVHEKWIKRWNSKAKGGNKWEDNPFVFVYDFEVLEVEK